MAVVSVLMGLRLYLDAKKGLNPALVMSSPVLAFVSDIPPRSSQVRMLSHFIIILGKAEPLVDIMSELTHEAKKHRSQFCS